VTTGAELTDVRSELNDRFGPPPPEVERLLARVELGILAQAWSIVSIHLEDQYAVFGYTSREKIDELARKRGKRLRVVDHRSAYVTLSQGLVDPDAISAFVKSLLQAA
jgi:transcription-repair coupling factor (superfamily II helicase)